MYENIRRTQRSSAILLVAFVFFILQVGDIYYSIKLEEPYSSYTVTSVPNIHLSFWLLINGLLGINISIYFFIYNYYVDDYRQTINDYYTQLNSLLITYFIFGLYLTSIGWIAAFNYINHIEFSLDNTIFRTYLWSKLAVQTFVYLLFGLTFFSK